MLRKLSIEKFIKELSDKSPTPGGGSAAALAGGAGTALILMSIELTLPKTKNKAISNKLLSAKKELQNIKQHQIKLIDKDAQSYNQVIGALKFPKKTAAQKEKRSQKIQSAYKTAALIPLQTASQSSCALTQLNKIKIFLSKNTASDIEVAELLLRAGLKGAIANARINLDCIKDKKFKIEIEKAIKHILLM